jgi:hypothetical protein
LLDEETELHYVIGLIPSHFKQLIREANNHFDLMQINETEVPVYRLETEIWGTPRTCIITISTLLKEGQIKGIHQHLRKKYKVFVYRPLLLQADELKMG